ncbi:hypothetical protein BMS3Abin02_01546 [bacterium BMS3Abin02]|nr:hypothetical protein BMS3Abin02_01546 [bacterium BMS3Abin02]
MAVLAFYGSRPMDPQERLVSGFDCQDEHGEDMIVQSWEEIS